MNKNKEIMYYEVISLYSSTAKFILKKMEEINLEDLNDKEKIKAKEIIRSSKFILGGYLKLSGDELCLESKRYKKNYAGLFLNLDFLKSSNINFKKDFLDFFIPRIKVFIEIKKSHPSMLRKEEWTSILEKIEEELIIIRSENKTIINSKNEGLILLGKWFDSLWE